jgi:low temperature requirement protein LtrA
VIRITVLRDRSAVDSPRVTNMELFFDLVYVFAVTQLSHRLLEHLTVRGAVQTLLLFMAVWWAWNYTAWATNWIDPDRAAVRVLLLVLMLLSLLMSAAIPDAFAGRALTFAAAYVGLQLLRSAFMVASFPRGPMRRNYAQLLTWSAIAGAAWIAGALVDGDARLLLWAGAVVLDYAAPMHGFALPGAGRTAMQAWTLAGTHLAERCQLVLLIALGESILAVGATFGGLPTSAPVVAAFVVGFTGTAALWWVYFAGAAEAGARMIAQAADPARVGRAGYAYAHAVMVAGVIVLAVSVDLTIAHPTGATAAPTAAVILAGPAIYLAGNAWFKLSLGSRPPWSRLVAIAALAALAPLALVVGPLVLNGAAVLVTVALALVATPRGHAEAPAASPAAEVAG